MKNLSYLTLFLGILMACQSDRKNTNEIRVALRADPLSLDPHVVNDAASFRVIENMYSRLFRYADEYGEVEKELVQDYEFRKDGRELYLKVRPDVFFSYPLDTLNSRRC